MNPRLPAELTVVIRHGVERLCEVSGIMSQKNDVVITARHRRFLKSSASWIVSRSICHGASPSEAPQAWALAFPLRTVSQTCERDRNRKLQHRQSDGDARWGLDRQTNPDRLHARQGKTDET